MQSSSIGWRLWRPVQRVELWQLQVPLYLGSVFLVSPGLSPALTVGIFPELQYEVVSVAEPVLAGKQQIIIMFSLSYAVIDNAFAKVLKLLIEPKKKSTEIIKTIDRAYIYIYLFFFWLTNAFFFLHYSIY